MCAIDGGGTSGFVVGDTICTDGSASPGVAVSGHNAVWPDITAKTGWNIIAPAVGAIDDSYVYGATKSGQTSINCLVSGNSCQ